MTAAALALEELLGWSDESTRQWMQFLASTPAACGLPCGIYGCATVLGLVRHIVAVELRHGERLAGLPVTAYEEIPEDSLAALAALHGETMQRFRELLGDSTIDWAAEIEFPTRSAVTLRATRRKLLAHALLHSIRHWAQLATLLRTAGYQPGIAGDLLASSALS
jgi:uncharacterized damage-inducible protein DinB